MLVWCVCVCGVCVCDFWRFTQAMKKLDEKIAERDVIITTLEKVCHIAVAVMSVIMYWLTREDRRRCIWLGQSALRSMRTSKT